MVVLGRGAFGAGQGCVHMQAVPWAVLIVRPPAFSPAESKNFACWVPRGLGLSVPPAPAGWRLSAARARDRQCQVTFQLLLLLLPSALSDIFCVRQAQCTAS